MKPQTRAILQHLREIGPVTPREALRAYGCDRLAARVWELRHIHGKHITRELVMGRDGSRFARYSLKDMRRVA